VIRLTDTIWIGDSADSILRVNAVLNVAQDLRGAVGWPDVEYMQVGLIDGPGNPLTTYYAAVLALSTLVKRHRRTLVCCHTGGRSLAVAMMYLNTTAGHDWEGLLGLLRERVDVGLPVPHGAHKVAFGMIDWKLLARIGG
jgi:hypothetical protein